MRYRLLIAGWLFAGLANLGVVLAVPWTWVALFNLTVATFCLWGAVEFLLIGVGYGPVGRFMDRLFGYRED